jgi:hypothetical protein
VKRPGLPSFLLGTVRVPVPKINVWLGLLGIVLAYVGLIGGWWLALSVGLGAVAVMPFGVAFHWLAQWRFGKKVAHWPVHVQVMPGADGERVAFVTAHDGTVSTMILPDDYDPEDDGGEWFIRQVAPELAADIFDEEDE